MAAFPSLAGQGEGERASGSLKGVLCRKRWASTGPLARGGRQACLGRVFKLALAALLTAYFHLWGHAGQPLEDGWRVEVKIRTTGTSLGTTDAVRFLPSLFLSTACAVLCRPRRLITALAGNNGALLLLLGAHASSGCRPNFDTSHAPCLPPLALPPAVLLLACGKTLPLAHGGEAACVVAGVYLGSGRGFR
jgi:hypothetical protein